MESELCVVTLNCWGIRFISSDREARMDAIANQLASGKYDFVFLQEVWTTEDYERIKKRTKAVLPYSYYFFSGVSGAGICIFSKAEIRSAFFHQWAVNGYVHKIQHGDWFGGKGIGMVEVVYKGLTINLYTTHLHAEYNSVDDEYRAHRVTQAFDTAQFIRMTSRNADLVIVGGDLNTVPGDIVYKVIIHTAQLKDSVFDADNSATGFDTCNTPYNSYTTKKNAKRIDYICFKSGVGVEVKAISSEVPWPHRVPNQDFSFSDHEAVVAKLRINKKPSYTNTAISSDAKKEVLLESIEICSTALNQLDFSKKMYGALSTVCFFVLLCSCAMELSGMFWIIVPVVRVLCILILVFGLIMGILWNRIEVNGILSGLLAMKLEIGPSTNFEEVKYAGGDVITN